MNMGNTIVRKKTRQITLGTIKIGGGAPVAVQSMCNSDTRDVESTLAQIRRLEQAGCEIVRLAVPDEEAAKALGRIRKGSSIPLVADIHFDHRLALEAVKQGVDGLRINPRQHRRERTRLPRLCACKDKGVPIRIGVNAGSLENICSKNTGIRLPRPLLRAPSAISVSLRTFIIRASKSRSRHRTCSPRWRRTGCFQRKPTIPSTSASPEAGTLFSGTIKSSVGLGILLSEGIGDTVRVSLTADPVQEVRVAYGILKIPQDSSARGLTSSPARPAAGRR